MIYSDFIVESIRLHSKNKKILEKSIKFIDKKVKWYEALIASIVLSLLFHAIIQTMAKGFNSSQLAIALLNHFIGVIVWIFLGYGILHLTLKGFKAKSLYSGTLKFGLATTIFIGMCFFVLDILAVLLPTVLSPAFAFLGILLLIYTVYMFAKIYSKANKMPFKKALFAVLITLGILVVILSMLLAIIYYSYPTGALSF